MLTQSVTVKPDPPRTASPIVFEIRCAWCLPAQPIPDGVTISHGICNSCEGVFFPELALSLRSEFSEVAS